MKRYFVIVLLLAMPLLGAAQTTDKPASGDKPANSDAQQHRQGRGMRQGMAGIIGEMKPDGFTLKNRNDNILTVKVNSETRFNKDRQPAKLSDFKPGDFVIVEGEPIGDNTWTARFVGSRSPMDMQTLREGMGKQFIAGEVKAIDGTKLTIARVDGQTQNIEVDENTSFRKGRESITLPDIKVGDRVFGRGALNAAGVFVPQVLNVGGGGGFGMGMAGPREQREAPPK